MILVSNHVPTGNSMLSRVAYNIYWAARYLERAENVARFLAVNQDLSLDQHSGDETGLWAPLIQTTGDHELYAERYGEVGRDDVLHFLAYDREYANSIISSLWMARENARAVRNVITRELWLCINGLYLEVKELAGRGDVEDNAILSFSDTVKMGCMTVQGVKAATMSRDEIWHWWRIGTMLERADKTSRILDVKYFMLLPSPQHVGSNFDHVQWLSLLDSASAAQMFRQAGKRMTPPDIAGYLILDQRFPRAIAHAIAEADESLHAITGTPRGQFANEAERTLGRFRAELCYADIDVIIEAGLHEYLDDRQQVLNQIDGLLYSHYFGGELIADQLD